jgi:hypothetical protein
VKQTSQENFLNKKNLANRKEWATKNLDESCIFALHDNTLAQKQDIVLNLISIRKLNIMTP